MASEEDTEVSTGSPVAGSGVEQVEPRTATALKETTRLDVKMPGMLLRSITLLTIKTNMS